MPKVFTVMDCLQRRFFDIQRAAAIDADLKPRDASMRGDGVGLGAFPVLGRKSEFRFGGSVDAYSLAHAQQLGRR